MEQTLTGVTEKKKIEICIVNLTMLLYLFRASIPFLKFPFIFLFALLIIYSTIVYRSKILASLKEFIRSYYLLLFLALIIVVALFTSSKLYLIIFKDAINAIILLSLFFLTNIIIHEKNELIFFVRNLVFQIILFALMISILNIMDLLDILSFKEFSQVHNTGGLNSPDIAPIDYNFALLPLLFGIVGVFGFLNNSTSKLQKVLYNLMIAIYSLAIILSGSRRGIFILILIFAGLILIQAVLLFKRNNFLKKIISDWGFYILTLISLVSFLILFFSFADYEVKNKTIEYLGTKNLLTAKSDLSNSFYRYITVFNKNISYSDFHKKIWSLTFDPKDPDSGWGTRSHKTVYPLTGTNVGIVPSGVKGYLMDSSCNATYYSNIDLCESYTRLVNLKVRKGDRYKASVYCFVSDVIIVDAVSFGVPSSFVTENIVSEKTSSFYNLGKKGVWEKLEVEFCCNDGNVPLYLSFWKKGAKDFSKLKGYVIFAFPQYEKIDNHHNENSLTTTHLIDAHNPLFKCDLPKWNKNVFDSKVYSKSSQNRENCTFGIQKLETPVNKDTLPLTACSSGLQRIYFSGVFFPKLNSLFTFITAQIDNDPVRIWASKFISEDTTYYPYKSKIVLDTISNLFLGERVLRWEFALCLYSREYSIKQKIFGDGFNFLNWYGYYFLKDKTQSDWPHNPLLSIMLYSGIVGLLIYFYFMYKVFYYYIKYIKKYTLLFIFFAITFFFAFFSGNSPFDPPIMGFFVILPFFIHSIHIRADQNTVHLQTNQESTIV